MSYKHDLHNDRFYDIIFQQKEGGYFIELGGLDGSLLSQTHFLEKERGWNGIVVEPNPLWTNNLKENRKCVVVTQPVSDKNEKVTFLQHVDLPEHSKIDNGVDLPDGEVKSIEMESITLSTILKQNDVPEVVDVLCLDIEGMELKVLDEVFKNSNTKFNLISLEHFPENEVSHFFYDKPYIRIRNPFLDFVRIDRKKHMVVTYTESEFKYLHGEIFSGSILDLEKVNWEFYYIHLDMIKTYPVLKKLLETEEFFNIG